MWYKSAIPLIHKLGIIFMKVFCIFFQIGFQDFSDEFNLYFLVVKMPEDAYLTNQDL